MTRYIFLFFFSLCCLSSLFNQSWPRSHDGIYHAVRINKFFQEFINGQFPVRWVNDLDNHYGLPVFNYIYPGPYLLASIPMLLGCNEIVAYKIIMFFAYFLGISGIYALFSPKNKFLALAASLIFGLTPYLFLDIFVRGALAEVVALGFMPWVIYGFTYHKNKVSIWSLFFVIISHNFLGAIFLFFLIAKLFWDKNFNHQSAKNILFALGLSAFFTIPMIFERQYLTSGYNNNFTFDYRQHFLLPSQLIYGKWDYWYSNPGPVDGMSFQLGFTNILIIIFSLISLIFLKNKRIALFLQLVVLLTLFLTLECSQFVWETIKPLQTIQFPWRLLFLSTLLCPMLFFESISHFPKLRLSYKYFLAFFLIILAVFNVRNYRRPMEYLDSQKYQQLFLDENYKSTTSSRDEIAPTWSPKLKDLGGRVIIAATGQEVLSQRNPKSIEFEIKDISFPVPVTILKNYFPGWKLTDLSHNRPISIQPDSNGNVTVTLPPGRYGYRYHQTQIEIIANLISISSFVILLLISTRSLYLKKYGKN